MRVRLRTHLICGWLCGASAMMVTPGWAIVHISQPASIPMRDGRSLACDIYLPPGQGPWPVVFIQTPYDKNAYAGAFSCDSCVEPLLKNPNYAFVIMDWRGFYGSAGTAYSGSPTVGQDGHDAVEWIAAQLWCDGRVGMWGASASGVVQLQTAVENPPHLRCAVPITYHYQYRYELTYPGGVYARNRNNFIAGTFGGMSMERQHPYYDSYWQYVEAYGVTPASINVPMLHVYGWYDHEDSTITDMQTVQLFGGFNALGQQKLVIGPWTHGHSGELQQGQLQYPAAELDSSEAAVEFFDHCLRGVDNGYPLRPVTRYFRLNDDAWIAHSQWPPRNSPMVLYLRIDRSLTPDVPTVGSAWLEYVSNPLDPVPTLFGAVVTEGAALRGPGDLRPIESRPDVLSFTTPPMTAPLTIEGTVEARVWISCQTPGAVDTDVAVRMTQVYPDGESMLLVDGIRRASLRGGYATPQFLTMGTPVEVRVKLLPVSVTIPAGQSLRILVAPSNYDLFDVNLQDGSSFSDQPGGVPTTATIRVWADQNHPSRITLPTPVNLAPPDFDRDGDVDEADLTHLLLDRMGPAVSTWTLVDSDLDGDGDVDQSDFGLLQRCYSGADIPADPACAAFGQ
ncbi:MAG: CocE/NonD family hydrolase [Planctomycetes bacterium]|nr:CocE/NonD family hydrolase [Planctomycetota bacterium]